MTAGIGAEALAHSFERAHDDYNAILVKALADRLAEAFAAYLHAAARRDWGGAEAVTPEDILAERHRGIRPGFGYPACPDHSEKFKLFDLLQARTLGIELTEHAAMTPAASVSGLYFAHPQARYFSVGRLGEDQLCGLRPPEGPEPRRHRAVADVAARLRARKLLRPGQPFPSREGATRARRLGLIPRSPSTGNVGLHDTTYDSKSTLNRLMLSFGICVMGWNTSHDQPYLPVFLNLDRTFQRFSRDLVAERHTTRVHGSQPRQM